MITIIDYNMGNLHSVQKAFDRIGVPAIVTRDYHKIRSASKIVIPGVGFFKMGMENLRKLNLLEILNEAVLNKKVQVLGICLGMQLMTDFSEEGDEEGLGWIHAETRKFNFKSNSLKIPHMGWNSTNIRDFTTLFRQVTSEDLFYFVHSYRIQCKCEQEILAETTYEDIFVSAFNKDNIFGCQFHPEKSHKSGLKLLKNFSEL